MTTETKRLAIAPTVIVLVMWSATMASARTEEPEYQPVEAHDGWELRRYEPTLQAVVVVEGDFRQAMGTAFNRLGGVIFGKNTAPGGQGSQKIAMTAPVTATPKVTEAGGKWSVTFTMPASYTEATLPRPVDERVKIVRHRGGLYAVRQFSGRMRLPADWATHEQALREGLAAKGLEPSGDAVLAQYNGPWVPGPMRRNEVLIPVRCQTKTDQRCNPTSSGAPRR